MLKKQIGSLVLMVCMLTAMPLALPAQAEGFEILPTFKGQSNMLTNADFETIGEDGGFANWTPIGAKWENNAKISVETDRVHSGKYAVKIVKDEPIEMPWVRQMLPVEGGAKYQMTGWFYLEGATPLLKFEGYNANIISSENATTSEAIWFDPALGRGDMVDYSTGKMEYGKWVQFSYIFTPHVNTRYIALYIRAAEFDMGTVWFDDLSVHMVEGPYKFTADLNSYNYYVTETEGILHLSANTKVYSEIEEWAVETKVFDGETVIWEKKIPFASGKEEMKIDLTGMTATERKYIMEVQLYEGETPTEKKTMQFARKYEKPQAVGEDKLWRDENGEVFHPVISYHLFSRDQAQKYIKEMGINTLQMIFDYVADPQEGLEYLDFLHSLGAKGFVTLYYNNLMASDPRNAEMVKKYIETIKDHPAVWAYGIMDEPAGKNIDEKIVTESYELVREADPDHPVYCIDQREWMYPQLIRNLDVLGIDNYPYGVHDAMTYIYDSTKYAVEFAGQSGKPVYPILQLEPRGSGPYTKLSKYLPTGNAIRNMIYQSLMAGAKGFGYYAFDSYTDDGKLVAETETGDAIRSYYKLEQDLMFDYFVEEKYPTFNSNVDDSDEVRWVSFVKDGEIYMVIMNKKEYEETEVTIPLISDNGLVKVGSFSAEPYAGGGEATRGIQNISVKLDPAAVDVYVIKPAGGVDTKKLAIPKIQDLADYAWAEEAISVLAKKEFVNMPEKNLFLPGKNITRGEFAYFLVRTLGLENEGEELFADVDADSFYAKEIAVGKAAGILQGVGEDCFAPEAEISRQDMMTLIVRGMGLKGKTDLSGFSDIQKVAEYAAESVEIMIANGLIEGNADGTINPLGNTTRAEAAIIMYRIMEKMA